jgi:hypothetical protein
MKSVIILEPIALVPITLIDADHPTGVDGKAAVGQVVGRIGENHVYRFRG